ncbi:MAG: C1 family peptidase [Bryobacteraceae bacterium]
MKRYLLTLLAALCLFACPRPPDPITPVPDGGSGGVAATGGTSAAPDAGTPAGGALALGGGVSTGGQAPAIVTNWPDWDACSRQLKRAEAPVKRTFGLRRAPRSRRTVQPWHDTGVVVASAFHPMLVAPLDQGALGACTGFATAGCLSTWPFGLKLTNADGKRIYSLATKLDGFSGSYPPTDTGSDGNSAMAAAIQLGLVASKTFSHAETLADMHAGIQFRAGIFGSTWTTEMSKPKPDGYVTIGGDVEGGHQYAYVGFDKERGDEVFRNSWGKGYGCDGYFRIRSDNVQTLIDDGADADFADVIPANDNATRAVANN